MKKLFLVAAVAGLFPATAMAQDGENKLTIPSSPAFSILNFEPTAVLKPTTNKDLAADVLNAFDKNGKLIANLGLEVSPYWLQSRPTLTRKQYLNAPTWQCIKQSFSLSAATVKDSASGDTKLGTGFRFKLYNGKPVEALKAADAQLLNEMTITSQIGAVRAQVIAGAITTVRACIDQVMTNVSAQLVNGAPPSASQIHGIRTLAEKLGKEFHDDKDDLVLFLDKLIEEQVESYDQIANQVEELTYQRKGWIVEVAGASGFNTSHSNDLERAGIWGNVSNYVSATDLFSFTGRYMWQNKDTTTSNFDAGISYLKQGERYNISLEAMLRWYSSDFPTYNLGGERIMQSKKDFTYRVAMQGSYLITKDLSVNLSFGKGFSAPGASATGFFSILGFNYSIFNKEYVHN